MEARNFTRIYHFNCNKNGKNSGKVPICLIIVFMIMIVIHSSMLLTELLFIFAGGTAATKRGPCLSVPWYFTAPPSEELQLLPHVRLLRPIQEKNQEFLGKK